MVNHKAKNWQCWFCQVRQQANEQQMFCWRQTFCLFLAILQQWSHLMWANTSIRQIHLCFLCNSKLLPFGKMKPICFTMIFHCQFGNTEISCGCLNSLCFFASFLTFCNPPTETHPSCDYGASMHRCDMRLLTSNDRNWRALLKVAIWNVRCGISSQLVMYVSCIYIFYYKM